MERWLEFSGTQLGQWATVVAAVVVAVELWGLQVAVIKPCKQEELFATSIKFTGSIKRKEYTTASTDR